VIVWMFVALVIVPFVMLQAHVDAAGPLAVLPVEPEQTELEPGVIVGVGFELTVTANVCSVLEQPAFTAVTWSVPEVADAEKVTWLLLAAPASLVWNVAPVPSYVQW
jgi:hypothetical protein